ncbi:hypothetical protein AB1J05_08480 [Staphylococcus cohnii species complex 1658]|uniref:hypothetical protein n=1 Tax=Staphylococcus cohnii species complex 1658 TaxID=3239424 RepID=UPI0034D95414
MLLKLGIIFIVFVINSIVTYYLTTNGTWVNLLLKSLSLSLIIVFIYNYVKLMIKIKRQK